MYMSVLIPSEQGKCSNLDSSYTDYRSRCLNPFGTGKVFKQLRQVGCVCSKGLNPFGTGKVFKHLFMRKSPGQWCLNPFGTGKVFKQMSEMTKLPINKS